MKKVKLIKYISLSIIFIIMAFLSCILFTNNNVNATDTITISSTHIYWDEDNNLVSEIEYANSLTTSYYRIYIYKDSSIANETYNSVVNTNKTLNTFLNEHNNYVYRANTFSTYYINGEIVWKDFVAYDENTHSSLGIVDAKDIPEGIYYCVLTMDVNGTDYCAAYSGVVSVGSGTNPEHYDYTTASKISVHQVSNELVKITSTQTITYKNIDSGIYNIDGNNDYILSVYGQTYPTLSLTVSELQNNAPAGMVFGGLYTASTQTVQAQIINGSAYGPADLTIITGYLEKFYDENLNPVGTFTKDSDVVLYPKYIDATYFVGFDKNGGTGTMPIQTYTVGASGNLPDCAFTRTGYTFLGWDYDQNAKTPRYSNQASLSELNGSANAGIYLYAIWQANKYSLTIKYGNGTPDKVTSYTYGDPINPETNPTREGYAFMGWSEEIPYTMPDRDVTISAVWNKTAKIRYYVDINSDPLVEYEYVCGSKLPTITPPADPSKNGYVFAGWDQTIPTYMPNSDLNIVAKFNQIYKLTIRDNVNMDLIFMFNGVKDTEIDYSGLTLPTINGYKFCNYDIELPSVMPDNNLDIQAIYEKVYTLNVYKELNGELIFTYTGAKDSTIEYGTLSDPVKGDSVFCGWSTELPTKMPEENLNIYAKWDEFVWLRFYSDDGTTLVSEFEIQAGASLSDIKIPIMNKSGYQFMGWDGDIPTNMPANDLTFNAIYEEIYELNIYFEENGQSIFSYKSIKGITIDYNGFYTPTKEGYNFNGWSSELPTEMPEGGISIYANWSIGKYRIAFKVNGYVVSPIIQEYGTEITAPKEPILPGYKFMGWVPEIPQTMPGQNMVITGSFEKVDHTITIKNNNGSEDIVKTIGHNYAFPTLTEPTKEHYHFMGWSEEIPKLVTEDMVIEAIWEINKHTITFVDCNEGADISIEYDYAATIEIPNYSKKAYDFINWSSNVPTTMPDEDVTVTALWVAHKYKITYEINGENDTIVQEYAYKAKTKVVDDPTKEGYTFLGWDAQIPSIMPDKDINVKAMWKINTYKLIYKVDGAIYKEFDVEYNTKLTSQEPPEKEGYTFVSWGGAIPTTMPANDLEFIAEFSIKTFVVTFFDGEGNTYNKQTINYNEKVKLIDPPTLENYTFVNWVTNKADENSIFNFEQIITSNTKVYPIFKELDKYDEISQTIDNCKVVVTSPDGLYNDTTLQVVITQNEDLEDPETASKFIIDYSKYLPMDESILGCVYNVKLMRDGVEYKRNNLNISLEVPENLRQYTLYLYHVVDEDNWEWVEHFDYHDGKINLNVNDLQEFVLFYYRDEQFKEDPIDYIPLMVGTVITVAVVIGASIGIGIAVKRKRQRDAFDW